MKLGLYSRSIPESLVLVEYVDEAFSRPPLLPTEPHDRATCLLLGSLRRSKVCAAVLDVLLVDGGWWRGAEGGICDGDTGNLLLLEGQLKWKRFFRGDAIGLVGITAGGMAHWLGDCEVTLVADEEFPGLCRWAKATSRRRT